MAPPKPGRSSAKPGSGKKPAKPIVPAIPLPHIKRQAAAKAAAAAASNAKTTSVPEVEAEVKDTKDTKDVPAPKPEIESPAASATTVDSANDTPNAQSTASTSPSAIEQQSRPQDDNTDNSVAKDDTAEQKPEKSSAYLGGELSEKTPSEIKTQTDVAPQPAVPESGEILEPKAPSAFPLQQGKATAPRSSGFRPPNQYPTFRPQNPPINTNGTLSGGPHTQGHTSYPSNDNIHFGTFHDSTNSSPAPPLSGGGMPVPGAMPYPNGRHHHGSHPSNGYPPTAPPGFDPYGRDLNRPSAGPYHHHGNSFPPNFAPASPNFPPTGFAQNGAAYEHFNGGAPRRSPPGFRGENAPQAPQHQVRGDLPHPGIGAPVGGPMIPRDDASDLVEHFRGLFGQETYADCFLELKKRDHRAAALQFPAHRAVLSRSPTLEHLIRQNARLAKDQTIVIETDDDWIDNSAFYMACHRLYGAPLLQEQLSQASGFLGVAGTPAERFNFALSYAASGRALGWNPVVKCGGQIAARLLTPDTLEAAMRFALVQHRDFGTHEEFKYGEGSQIILDGILDLVAATVPPYFQLDTSVSDAHGYARLPYDTPSAPSAPEESPVTVRGHHTGHFSQGSCGHNHPAIQFGDLSLEDGQTGDYASTPRASNPAARAPQAILSRVLINLPFGHLKRLAESRYGHLNGVVHQVIAEREARRLRALEALKTGRLPDSDAIRASLSSPMPPQPTPWTVLGWEETLAGSGRGDERALNRQWSPLREAQRNAVSDYP